MNKYSSELNNLGVRVSNLEDRVGYGNYDITKPGTYNLLMQYFNEDKNAFVADTLWNRPWNSNYKGWKPLLTMP